MACEERDIALALRAYLGCDVSAFPVRDPEAVRKIYGIADAAPLLNQIERLLIELGHLRPQWEVHSLASATEWAKDEMKKLHPELAHDALAALGWSFSYDWR